MFGLGFTEIIVILVVALLALGPEKLPGVARSLGKTLGEFRRAMDEIRREINIGELEQDLNSVRRARLTVSDLGLADDQPNTNCETKESQPAIDAAMQTPEAETPVTSTTPKSNG